MPAIVYLTPQGIGAYRSGLRSDTLWGALCWSIRELFGEKAVGDLVKAYLEPPQAGSPVFYLSSAFPWQQTAAGRTHYLPHPFVPPSPAGAISEIDRGSPAKIKAHFRHQKANENTRKGWISWEAFATRFGNGTSVQSPASQPEIKTRAVTRNQIDRRRLATFTDNGSGQLFHMSESYFVWPDNSTEMLIDQGLYFLLDGDLTQVIPALRLLETWGLAGDRTVGKGHFKIDWQLDAHQLPDHQFGLPRVNDPNAQLCLSVFHHSKADKAELKAYEQASANNPALWQYRLEVRQGRTVLQGNYLQDGRLLFSEGSVFPITPHSRPFPGHNWLATPDPHRLGHKIYRYGHAFMLNMRVTQGAD